MVLPTGFNGVFQSYDYNERVATEDVTAYDSSAKYGAFVSNGTPVATASCSGFLIVGASNTSPGFNGAGSTMTDNDGGAATFTVDTGTTLAGNFIVTEVSLSHARTRGAVSARWSLQNAGDITVTWASS